MAPQDCQGTGGYAKVQEGLANASSGIPVVSLIRAMHDRTGAVTAPEGHPPGLIILPRMKDRIPHSLGPYGSVSRSLRPPKLARRRLFEVAVTLDIHRGQRHLAAGQFLAAACVPNDTGQRDPRRTHKGSSWSRLSKGSRSFIRLDCRTPKTFHGRRNSIGFVVPASSDEPSLMVRMKGATFRPLEAALHSSLPRRHPRGTSYYISWMRAVPTLDLLMRRIIDTAL